MKHRSVSASLLIGALPSICSGFSVDTLADDGSSAAKIHESPIAFFETLKTVLTGSWEGRFTNGTIEDPADWFPVWVDYRLTSNGSALVEDYVFGEGRDVSMTTVYHKDNNDLRLTHFCGVMNHPRMIAREFDSKTNTLRFHFVDVTNLTSPENYHSRQLELTILDDDHVNITYRGIRDGEDRTQAYMLTREGDSSASN